jgi:hypothetical protein
MQIIQTSFQDFSLHTDIYPYIESRDKLKSLVDWWEHPLRKNPKSIKSNYQLDSDLSNSLEKAFRYRMTDGCFNFLYYKNDVIAYAGLRIHNNEAFMTRMTVNPVSHMEHFGIVTAIIVPYQIRFAYEKGCRSYNMTFEKHREKMYNWYKDKLFVNSSSVKIKQGMELVSNFEFIGIRQIYGIEQYVAQFDFLKNNVDDIINFEVRD